MRSTVDRPCSGAYAPEAYGCRSTAALGRSEVRKPRSSARLTPATDFLVRAGVLAGIWAALTGSDWASWTVGGPIVMIAAYASRALGGRTLPLLRIRGLARFAIYFVIASWRGGSDIARRALLGSGRPQARFLEYSSRLAEGPARSLFCLSITLLPGTLVASIDGRHLTIHCMGMIAGVDDELRVLEDRVAELFGIALEQDRSGGGTA